MVAYSRKVEKNHGKRIRRLEKSKDHKVSVITLTTNRIDNNLLNNTTKGSNLRGWRRKAITSYISKLIRVIHFLAPNNLPVKILHPKVINFCILGPRRANC